MIKKKAFTLTEVMIAVLLGSLVMAAAFFFWSNSRKSISKYTVKMQLQSEADKISDALSADIKAAKIDDVFPINAGETYELNSLSFNRFTSDEVEGAKSSKERFQIVEYSLANKSLKRNQKGRTKVLSNNVTKLTLTRGKGADTSDAYRDARIYVELELEARIPGSNDKENLVRHTSIVLREDFYNKANAGRTDIFALEDNMLANLNQEVYSNYLSDKLSKEALMEMSIDQLNDLLDEQQNLIDDANKQLSDLEKQISKADLDYGYIIGWFTNDDQDALHKAEKLLKNSGSVKNAEEAAKIASDCANIEDKYLQKMIDTAFGNNKVDDIAKVLKDTGNNYSEETKHKAELQKMVLDMKIGDISIENNKAIQKQNKKELEKAEKDPNYTPSLTKTGIQSYKERSDEKIKDEIYQEMGIFSYDKDGKKVEKQFASAEEKNEAIKEAELEIQKQIAERNEVISLYDSLEDKTEALDPDKTDDNKIYQAAMQLKTFAETKKNILTIREQSEENKKEIQEVINTKKGS